MAREYDVTYASPDAIARLKAGLGRLESGNDYGALGPELQRKTGTDRAYGKYQVMGANIPAWTEQALGRKLTPFEFLRSPEAQEAVFENQMANNLRRYGTLEDAASVWFSGRPLAQAQKAGARDINMGVGDYVARALGPVQAGPGVQVAGGDEDLFRSLHERTAKRLGVTVAPTEMQQPAAAPPPPMGDPFAELHRRAAERIAPVPAPQANLVAPPATPRPAPPAPPKLPEDVWGAGSEYLNALTFGAYPAVAGAVGPYSSEQLQQMRQTYEQKNPLTSFGAEVAGGITQAVPLAIAAPYAGAAMLGSAALRSVPGMARAIPFIERLAAMRPGFTGPFPSGGYTKAPGIAAAVTRGAAGVGAGAVKGATQAAMNVGVHPEVPASEQIALGAGIGGAVEPVAKAIMGVAGPTMAPRIEEPIRDIGKLAQTKYNISLQPWQLSNMPAEEAISAKMLTPERALVQSKEFGTAVGKQFGHSTDFTAKNLNQSFDKIGNEMDTIAKNTRINLSQFGGRQLRRDIDDLVQEVQTDVADPADQAKFWKTIQILDNKLFNQPLTGEIIQSLTQKDGTIDRNISAKTNSLYQYMNGRLKDIVYETFHRADPANAAAWDAAKQKYKTAIAASKAATPAGILDPKVFAKAAKKVRAAGELGELADIGEQMFRVSEKGAPAVPLPPTQERRFWERPWVQIVGAGAAPFAAGSMSDLGQTVLSGIGLSPTAAGVGGALGAAALHGGRMGFEGLKREMLASPLYSRAIMQGEVPVRHNVLAGPAPRSGAVSIGETVKGRRAR